MSVLLFSFVLSICSMVSGKIVAHGDTDKLVISHLTPIKSKFESTKGKAGTYIVHDNGALYRRKCGPEPADHRDALYIDIALEAETPKIEPFCYLGKTGGSGSLFYNMARQEEYSLTYTDLVQKIKDRKVAVHLGDKKTLQILEAWEVSITVAYDAVKISGLAPIAGASVMDKKGTITIRKSKVDKGHLVDGGVDPLFFGSVRWFYIAHIEHFAHVRFSASAYVPAEQTGGVFQAETDDVLPVPLYTNDILNLIKKGAVRVEVISEDGAKTMSEPLAPPITITTLSTYPAHLKTPPRISVAPERISVFHTHGALIIEVGAATYVIKLYSTVYIKNPKHDSPSFYFEADEDGDKFKFFTVKEGHPFTTYSKDELIALIRGKEFQIAPDKKAARAYIPAGDKKGARASKAAADESATLKSAATEKKKETAHALNDDILYDGYYDGYYDGVSLILLIFLFSAICAIVGCVCVCGGIGAGFVIQNQIETKQDKKFLIESRFEEA